jgi:hypothetical protein
MCLRFIDVYHKKGHPLTWMPYFILLQDLLELVGEESALVVAGIK